MVAKGNAIEWNRCLINCNGSPSNNNSNKHRFIFQILSNTGLRSTGVRLNWVLKLIRTVLRLRNSVEKLAMMLTPYSKCVKAKLKSFVLHCEFPSGFSLNICNTTQLLEQSGLIKNGQVLMQYRQVYKNIYNHLEVQYNLKISTLMQHTVKYHYLWRLRRTISNR